MIKLDKNLESIKAGHRYTFKKYRFGELEQTFTGTVRNVEDRGEYIYCGYQPDDFRVCRWGYLKIKKVGLFGAINWELESLD